jgi:hypothetical protein
MAVAYCETNLACEVTHIHSCRQRKGGKLNINATEVGTRQKYRRISPSTEGEHVERKGGITRRDKKLII